MKHRVQNIALGRLAVAVMAAVFTFMSVGYQPALAQQLPLPDKEATLVLGQPDAVSTDAGDGPAQLDAPEDALIDPVSKKLFVADRYNGRVLRYASLRALQSGAEAEHIFAGRCENSGEPNVSCMEAPTALALDGNGSLWVHDEYIFRVLRFDDAVTTSDTAADGVLGAADFDTVGTLDLGDLTVVGPDGDLLIAHDWNNYQYLYWDLSTLPANGASPTTIAIPPALAEERYGQMAYDYATGGLWIQDRGKNRILYYSDPTDLSSAEGVIGQANLTDSDEGTGATGLSYTLGIWASSDGTLFLHDQARILAYRDAAARAIDVLTTGVKVSADAVWGAETFDSEPYNDVSVYGAAYLDNSIVRFGGDPLSNVLAVPVPYSHRVLIFGEVPNEAPIDEPIDGPVETRPTLCTTVPDMAITPERIELAAGGTTTMTVTMRNLCADRPFSGSDLLVSLSDGLRVVDGSAGMLNLGRRAAWQGLSLAPGETRSWQVLVQADTSLPTAPLHVVELYYLGSVAQRIDGVFVGATVTGAVDTAPAAAADSTTFPMPAALPNTAGEIAPTQVLVAPAWLVAVMFGGALLLRRRT